MLAGPDLSLTSQDKTLRVWDSSAAKSLAVIRGSREAIRSVAVAGGKIVAGSDTPSVVTVWDPEGGEPLYRYCTRRPPLDPRMRRACA